LGIKGNFSETLLLLAYYENVYRGIRHRGRSNVITVPIEA